MSYTAIRKFAGTGSPEGVVTAPPGSVYNQTDATTGNEIWDKVTGTSNTGWRVRGGSTAAGPAGGSLAGTYPNPTLAAGVVGSTEVASAIKDAAAGTASLRTLGTGSQQGAAGNDSRLSDARTPTAGSVTDASVSASAGIAESKLALNPTSWKLPVRAATTANTSLSGTQTVDGVVLVAGDRILVKNQTTQSENGSYVVASGAWSRTTDADTSAKIMPNSVYLVNEGTTQSDTLWQLTTNASITLGTTSLIFTQFVGSPAGPAGGSLTGTYPNPTIAPGVVGSTEIATAIKSAAAGTDSLRQLGTGSTQAAAGNDSRLSDSRAPSGSASGDLTGSYPAPTLAGVTGVAGSFTNLNATIDSKGRVTAASTGVVGIQSVDTISTLQGLTGTSLGDTRFVRGYYNDGDGGAKHVRRTNSGATVDGGAVHSCADGGTARWEMVIDNGGTYNVLRWGFKRDGSTDNATVMSALLTHLAANTLLNRIIFFPAGSYNFASTILISTPGIRVVGERIRDNDSHGGTRLNFTGSGALFQLGTADSPDLSANYATGAYSGLGNFSVEDATLWCLKTDGTLANGMGTYGLGTSAVKDWRGGSINMDRVAMYHWENAFWGIWSDVNEFWNLILGLNKNAMYLGPRCDQNKLYNFWTWQNDTVFTFDGPQTVRIYNWEDDSSGSATTPPAKITSSYSARPTWGVHFHEPWLEHYLAGTPTVDAYIELGISSTTSVRYVTIENPHILTSTSGTTARTKWLLKADNATEVFVARPYGDITNLDQYVDFVGTGSPQVFVQMPITQDKGTNNYINNGSGTPQFISQQWGNSAHYFYSANRRQHFRSIPANTLRDFWISCEADHSLTAVWPDDGTGNTTRFKRAKRDIEGTAAPTTLTWEVGDFCRNTAPAVTGSAGSQYIIIGWICTVAGTPGTWINCRAFTGT